MKPFFAMSAVILSACAIAQTLPSDVTARGRLYITFDVATETTVNGVLFARFVPSNKDIKKFPAVTSGPYSAPIRYISFEPAEALLEAAVGKERAARLSHGSQREVEIPVELVLRDFSTDIECDSRVYFATFISLRPLTTEVSTTSNPPYGC